MTPLLIPVSPGELIDKITILRVKAERISEAKRENVQKELALLEGVAVAELSAALRLEIAELVDELTRVNAALWEIEEAKRACERQGVFGPDFIALARQVYKENDRRAAIKRLINAAAGSDLMEEKSYAPY